jgi:hypothetical protein
MIYDSDDARQRTRNDADAQQLERRRIDTNIESRQTRSGRRHSRDTAMVGCESVDVYAGPRPVDHLIAASSKTAHNDRVMVVPCLTQEHDVDQLIAALLQQVVQLVAQRPNV